MKYGQIWMKKYAEWSEAKKNIEKLKEGLKSSILGPQNLGSGGARAPRAPPGSASDKTAFAGYFQKHFSFIHPSNFAFSWDSVTE